MMTANVTLYEGELSWKQEQNTVTGVKSITPVTLETIVYYRSSKINTQKTVQKES